MNINIDFDRLVDEATKEMAEKVVTDYLDASDIEDWDKRKLVSQKRHKKIIDKIDWSKAPDGLSMAAAKTFFEKVMSRVL